MSPWRMDSIGGRQSVSMEDGLVYKVEGEDTLWDKNGDDDNSNDSKEMVEEG